MKDTLRIELEKALTKRHIFVQQEDSKSHFLDIQKVLQFPMQQLRDDIANVVDDCRKCVETHYRDLANRAISMAQTENPDVSALVPLLTAPEIPFIRVDRKSKGPKYGLEESVAVRLARLYVKVLSTADEDLRLLLNLYQYAYLDKQSHANMEEGLAELEEAGCGMARHPMCQRQGKRKSY